ncbi:MAG: M56 family metallopeptidase [Planctomycetota bacterium]|jgi:beta-lactamase regulating signal transducer with metallopeptidase domain/protocatechuate 3,4-dioxygenase beta subunit
MIEQINNIAEIWWAWMWPMFWQVGVLVALIWLVDLVIRAKVWPQVRYALWLLVLVKLVLPPTFSLSTSVTSQLQPLAEQVIKQREGVKEIATVSYMGENSTASEPSFDRTVEPIVVPRESKSNDAVGLSAVTSAGDLMVEAEGERLSWRVYVMGAWLVGAVILAVLLMARFRQLRQAHRGRKGRADVPDWLSELLADTTKRLNLRRTPEVALSRKVTSPAVFGLFRPVLLLPEENIAGFSRKDFEHVLLHELAHLKRGDLWVHSVYMVLQIIYWFNPLLWFVRRQLQHLRELCCDATVAGILRERIVDYRETVVETARRLLDRPITPGMGLLGLFEDSNRLLVRLKWLEKKTWKHRALRIVTIFAVVALMFACILPMAKARRVATASESDEKTDVKVDVEPDRKSSESKVVNPAMTEPSGHAGRISGIVVSSATGEPVSGAYVGVGDFGDSGGSNYSRHRSQGFHDKTKTDEKGRFELDGLVFTDKNPELDYHPLVVTHPDFVRHDEKVKLLKDERVPDIKISLRPAARIDVTIVDADGNPLEGHWLLRLEALDGRHFLPPGGDPHLSSFASNIWAHWPDMRTKMGVSQGFTFNELDTGEYSIEAIRFHLVDNPTPQNIWKPTVTYHGSIPSIEIQAGQAKEVKLQPQDHQTLLTIIPPEFPDMLLGKLKRSSQMPLLCLISRSPGLLLWDNAKIYHLEDQRLGRIDKKRFFRGFFSQGKPLTVNNLPPGSYSFFVVAIYREVTGCLIGARAELAKGGNVAVEIPWRQPTGPSLVGPNRSFDYPVQLEERDYSASEICKILTAITKSNPRLIAGTSIENEMLKLGERQMSIWDVLERLYLDKGWKLGEAPEKTLILEPEVSSTAKKHRVYLPDLETPHTNVILDLATGEMLQAMWLKNNKVAELGKGDVVYEYSSNRSSLLCLRGATMQLRTNAGLSSLKVDIQREYFAGYLLKEVPCQYQVTTAEGDKYELKVISIDKGDAGGTFIEFWKSEKQKTDVPVEVGRSDKSSESKSGSDNTLYGTVTGTVRFHGTDAPASGVVVKTISKWFDTVQARTDQQGNYTLAGIRPEAVFHVSAEDEEKELFMTDIPAVVLKAGEAKTGVDLMLYAGRKGSISGKVVGRRIFYKKPERLTRNIIPENFERRQDSPLSGVEIVLKSNTGILKETITDETGRYRFEGLRADGYVVRAEQPAGVVAETVRTLPMAGPGRAEGHGSSQSRWVELKSEPKTDIDFHFRLDWVSISGRVTDADGNPVSGIKVGAELCSPKMDGGEGRSEGRSGAFSTFKISWGSVSMISGDDGRYRLDGLCPVTFSETATYLIHGKLYRRYEVRIQAEGYSPARLLVPPVTEQLVGETSRLMEDYKGLYGERDSSSAEVALPETAANTINGIDFVLQKAAMITGRVLDTQGNILARPRQKVLVRMVPVDLRDDKNETLLIQIPDRTSLDWIALDETGRFKFSRVGAGSYFFEIKTRIDPHGTQRARNETLVVKAGEVIRDIEVIVPSEAVSEGQKVVGTWEMVEVTGSEKTTAAIMILRPDGTYFLEASSPQGQTVAKAGTYTVKDGRIHMSDPQWDSVTIEGDRAILIADSTTVTFQKIGPLKRKPEIKPSCVGAWRVRNQNVVYVIDRSGSIKAYGSHVPEEAKSLITGKYTMMITGDYMEVWKMKETDGDSSVHLKLERIKIDPKVVGSWRTTDVTDELGVDLTGIFLDLRQDATFVLQTKGRDTGKSIKGVYMMTDNDRIQLLSGEKELPIIRFARYDNGKVRLAIGNGAAVLAKQDDRPLNLEQGGKLQVYVTLNGKGQMAWGVSAHPAGEGPDAEISTQMGKEGRYELTGLKEAEYLVRAPVPLGTGVRGQATVQINNRARVKIEPGKETRLDFELRDNAGIRGSFTCPDKDLSWRILVFNDSAAVRDDSVSEVKQAHALIWKLEQGKHYEIKCLPPGTYRVVGRCCKKDHGWTPVMEKSKTVTVGAGQVAEVDFVFP